MTKKIDRNEFLDDNGFLSGKLVAKFHADKKQISELINAIDVLLYNTFVIDGDEQCDILPLLTDLNVTNSLQNSLEKHYSKEYIWNDVIPDNYSFVKRATYIKLKV